MKQKLDGYEIKRIIENSKPRFYCAKGKRDWIRPEDFIEELKIAISMNILHYLGKLKLLDFIEPAYNPEIFKKERRLK